MDKAWDDPSVQAAHWYNELDGKYGGEKPYGDALKAARNGQVSSDIRNWTLGVTENWTPFDVRLLVRPA